MSTPCASTSRTCSLGVWTGRLENDGFNRLVLAAGLSPRQIVTLRAYCRYMLQIGTPFSQAYVEQTLGANPGLARDLAALFDARFDPAQGDHSEELQAAIEARILDAAQPGRQPRPGPHPAPLPGAAQGDPAH